MSETTGAREPDDPMARQSGAVLEDVQPVAPSDRADGTAQEAGAEETVATPTEPAGGAPS
jgi:hypothetical protein